MDTVKILIFISRESATFNYVRRQVELACVGTVGSGQAAIEVVDIADRPEMAEEYNIEALPTIIVGNRRFVGQPSLDLLKTCLGLVEQPPASETK